MSKTILAFGELLWDVLPDKTILGGAPFNFAYRVHSLGNNSIFASRLGTDKLGNKAFETVKSLGVPTDYIQRDPLHNTGTVDVSFDENHLPDYVINTNVAFDFIQPVENLVNAAQSADCVCFGTLIQRSEFSKKTLQKILGNSTNAIKLLDINLRKKCFSLETIYYSLSHANILKLNDDEVFLLKDILGLDFNSIKEFCVLAVKNWELDYCLVTCGDKGAYVYTKDQQEHYAPGYQIELSDSLGSGDAFSAGFVHCLLNGDTFIEACEFGNILGALVATTPGATTAISSKSISNFKNQNHQRLYHPEFNH